MEIYSVLFIRPVFFFLAALSHQSRSIHHEGAKEWYRINAVPASGQTHPLP